MLPSHKSTDDAPTVAKILPESFSCLLGALLQRVRNVGPGWLSVTQYQSIDDTIVQLFIPQASVVMTRVDRIQTGSSQPETEKEGT